MTIGILAIMLDEADYAGRWVESIQRFPKSYDRVLVVDGGSSDGTADRLRERDIAVIERRFESHFADQRNFGCEKVGTDWILELDADEMASAPLLGGLRQVVANAEAAHAECVGLPRLNFIDSNLVEGPGHKHLDFQYRLHRNTCRWRGAVHEEITNYSRRYELQLSEGHFIIHDKSSARHAARNAFYQTLKP